MRIKNPILRGFHPDPSIVRVGQDYYIATSTFEWWPGVRLHHSTDLVDWRLIEYPLTRMSQLDLRGVGASQGVWAPCLTWDQGVFYLAYTVVKAFYCNMYDTNNYLVTAADIHGPWSEPIVLNHYGFDPSLFHDDDGRKYMVSMVTDHRVPKKYQGRLILQEYDPVNRCMTGEAKDIYQADRIFLEGPHLMKRNRWYYLFCADTGTGEGHGQSILRSRSVWGPYEMYKDGEAHSMMTVRDDRDWPLQKCGHGDLVETPDGSWYMVHLCGRPSAAVNPMDRIRFPGHRRYMLGRETAIQKVKWTEDDWLLLDSGDDVWNRPAIWPELPDWCGRPEVNRPETGGMDPAAYCGGGGAGIPDRDNFDRKVLSREYQSLRIPMDETYISLKARRGYLRMYGRSGLASKFSQSLIARRVTEYRMSAAARVEFEPDNFKQMAGLILLYDTDNYFYLHLSKDEDIGKCVTLLKAENRKYEYLTGYLAVPEGKAVTLSLELNGTEVSFAYQVEGEGPNPLYGPADASFLSDEACEEGWFTGSMCGICCQDLTGEGKHADFDWFEVTAKPEILISSKKSAPQS